MNKVEDLERLMNDEVTDINEILNVINTIQVILMRFSKTRTNIISSRLIKISLSLRVKIKDSCELQMYIKPENINI